MRLSKGFIYTCIAAICWTGEIIITRYLLNIGENAYNLAFWTTLLAAPYWLYIFWTHKKEASKLKRQDIGILLTMALVSTVGITFVEIFALKYSPAVNYSFLIRMVIVFTIFFASFILHEKITKKKIILTLLILTGSYFLVTNGNTLSLTKGDLFTLLEAALIALGNNVLGKVATNRMNENLAISTKFLIGFIPALILAALFTNITTPLSTLLIIFYTGLSLILNTAIFKAYKFTTATYVTMVMSFSPVMVALLAIPLLNEMLTPIQILGGILIVGAGISAEKLKI